MNKYIIKNCPDLSSQITYGNQTWYNGCTTYGKHGERCCCKDVSDCLIKKITEKCRQNIKTDEEMQKIRNNKWLYAFSKGAAFTKNETYKDILQLFDIVEVNE